MLFDTHVHLNADQYEEDLEEVIERAQEAEELTIWLSLVLTVIRLRGQWN